MNLTLTAGPSGAPALLVLLIFVLLYTLSLTGILSGRRPALRKIKALETLPARLEQYAEAGQAVHFSAGSGGLDGQSGSAEVLSGAAGLAAVSRLAARTSAGLVVSTNDILARQLAYDVARAEYIRSGRLEDFEGIDYRFITRQDRLAYAAGAAEILRQPGIAANIMIGRLDSEYLLVGERANRRHLDQVAGTSRLEGMPLVWLSAGPDNTLLGEEVFAVPAYLQPGSARLAGVLAQDRARIIIMLFIIAGVLAATLGLLPGLSDYFMR